LPEKSQYNYDQLYRFSKIGLGKAHSRRTLDKKMIENLAEIGFWWNEEQNRSYSHEEVQALITPPESAPSYNNQPQLSLLELVEVRELRERVERLSPVGRVALLAPITDKRDKLSKSLPVMEDKTVTVNCELTKFYRLRNWLIESLNILGRPGQPRTAAQEQGYKGRLGENLNLLFEGDRQVALTQDDYVALSYILVRIKGWNDLQPVIETTATYQGDWQGVILELRRCGHPAPL
jgi:hypothetical protein